MKKDCRKEFSVLGLDGFDDWYYRYRNHVDSSKRRGINSELTFTEYVELAGAAGIINPADIGRKLGKFVLGRYGDAGDYKVGNVRFITVEENHREAYETGANDAWIASRRTETKDNSERVRKAAETRRGRRIATHPYLSKMGDAKRGKTKETHSGIASQADKLRGRTKGTHESLARIADKLAKDYVVVDPSGTIHSGRNVKELCLRYGLHEYAMSRVIRGLAAHHKGWTIPKD